MPLIVFILAIVLIAVAMWWINAKVPMASPYKPLLNGLVFFCVVVFVLYQFGVLDYIKTIRVPHL